MSTSGRGLWPLATILFLATTLLFAYLTMHFRAQAQRSGPQGEPKIEDRAKGVEVEPPPKRIPSAWETESGPAPMANIPVHDLGFPNGDEFPTIEIKTTVHWLLFLYKSPEEVRRPELLLRGPGEKVYWGAGPLPDLSEGEARSLAVPGDFLPMGRYVLTVKGADGEMLHYTFRLHRKRFPEEESLEEDLEDDGNGATGESE
jgi:hypothetical protein